MSYDVAGPKGVATSVAAAVTCNATAQPELFSVGNIVALVCAIFAGIQCIISLEKWWRERKKWREDHAKSDGEET